MKAKHGGPRANSGGWRPGAGRTLDVAATGDPLKFLLAVMDHPDATPRLRIQAARAVLPYLKVSARRKGKKDLRQAAADRALRELPPGRAPALSVVKKEK